MSDSPQEVQLALADFDRSQLAEAQRALKGDEFRSAVQDHLTAEFIGEGGAAEIVVTEDRIIIRWLASAEAKTLTERGIDCLKDGDYEKGIAALRLALQRNPKDSDALFNLGMALSDKGSLDEAMAYLKRAVAAHPEHVHSWVALGSAGSGASADGGGYVGD